MRKNPTITAENDAFGQEIWAYFNRKPSFEVVERDDGFVDLSGGAQQYFSEYRKWPGYQKQAIRFAKGRVLDVGAGAGRVSLYLQNKGLKVTAIDNSPLAIKVCRKRSVKDARVVPFEEIGNFKPNSFDTVVMYGNNFGLFCNPAKAKLLLKKLHRITSPDALIIAETNDPYKTKDPMHLAYHRLNRKRGRMGGQLTIRVRFREYVGAWFDYLFVSKDEMREILRGTGWRAERFFDSEKSMCVAIIRKES